MITWVVGRYGKIMQWSSRDLKPQKCCPKVKDKKKYWSYSLNYPPWSNDTSNCTLSYHSQHYRGQHLLPGAWSTPQSGSPSPPYKDEEGQSAFPISSLENCHIKYLLPTTHGFTLWLFPFYFISNLDFCKALIEEQLNRSLVQIREDKTTFLTWIWKLPGNSSTYLTHNYFPGLFSVFVTLLFYNLVFYSLFSYWISDLMLTLGLR